MGQKKLSEDKLLTPDDWIIKKRIARKRRFTLSKKQLERRQQQVLGQLMK